MKKVLAGLIFSSALLFALNAVAQNKVVVVPLSTTSTNAAGTDGQIQYNDGGKEAGAEVYYDKATGRVGVGQSNPTEFLDVNGNVKANQFLGDGGNLTGVVTTESDPSVLTSVKDGVSWSEVGSRPAGLDDGDDVNDADANASNELNTSVILNGTTIEVTDAGGTKSADLSSLQDGTGTDDQTLSLVGTDLSIESGNTVSLGNFVQKTGDTISGTLDVLGDVTIGDGTTKTTLWLDFESDHAEIDNSSNFAYPWVASATNECQTNEGACYMVTEELPSTSTSEFSLNIHCFNAAGCTLSYDVAYSVGMSANIYEIYFDEDGTSDITDLQGVFGSGTSASASSCSPTILDACWKTRTKSLSLGPYTMVMRVYSGTSSSPKVLIDNIKLTNGKGTGDLHVYGQISAQLNKNVGDVAEYVPLSQPKLGEEIINEPLPGSIVVVNNNQEDSYDEAAQFSLSQHAYEELIAGVLSWSPSVLLNSPSEGEPLALTGRVKVRVSNETGPIKRGDPIASSSIPGVGMKALRTCRIVGFALSDVEESGNDSFDNLSNIKEIGTVLVLLQPGFWHPGNSVNSGDVVSEYTNLVEMIEQQYQEIVELKKSIKRLEEVE